MRLFLESEWFPVGASPEQLEREAIEMGYLFGKQEVLTYLIFNKKRLAIEWQTIHKIKSIFFPGPFEIPPKEMNDSP